jgi:hypothetical protein
VTLNAALAEFLHEIEDIKADLVAAAWNATPSEYFEADYDLDADSQEPYTPGDFVQDDDGGMGDAVANFEWKWKWALRRLRAAVSLRLITAADRASEAKRPKFLFLGFPGVGKTSLLKTLSPAELASTLFVDLEAGDIAIEDLEVASVRPRTWNDCRNIACAIGGPNPALGPNSPYSQAHHDAIIKDETLASLAVYSTLFIDSLTELSRQCRAWSELQPESLNQYGK